METLRTYTFEDLSGLMAQMILENIERDKRWEKKNKELENLFVGQWGKLIESLVEGDLVRLLNERGIMINDTSERRKKMFEGKEVEIDIIAKNGKDVVMVEVKTTLHPKHIDHFYRKLERIKEVFPEFQNNNIYGAMAYLREESQSVTRAQRKGFLVIRATGNSATIVNGHDFKPHAF